MPNSIHESAATITPDQDLIQEVKVDNSLVEEKTPLIAESGIAPNLNEDIESEEIPPHLVKKKKRWQGLVNKFNIAADISNIGIVISMISKAWPPIMTVLGGALGSVAWMTDGLIYTFRALSETTRILGRKLFGMNQENNCPFEEDKNGTHPFQTPLQLLSTALYSVAVAMMFGAIIASPVGVAAGWGLALGGLSIATYLNYVRPANQAKEKYEQLKANPNASPKEVQAAEHDYHEKHKTKLIFVGILLGVAALMLCGTIAVFAPPAIVPALLIISKLASAYLTMLNSYRVYDGNRDFFNKIGGYFKSLYNREKVIENTLDQKKELADLEENTKSISSIGSITQSLKKAQQENPTVTANAEQKKESTIEEAVIEEKIAEAVRLLPSSEPLKEQQSEAIPFIHATTPR